MTPEPEPSCPFCGAPVATTDVEPTRHERIALRIAGSVASWWYVLAVVSGAGIWIVFNLTVHPVEPFPTVMISGMAAGLGLLAGAYGPLVLISQRADARRDRARARAILEEVRATHDLVPGAVAHGEGRPGTPVTPPEGRSHLRGGGRGAEGGEPV